MGIITWKSSGEKKISVFGFFYLKSHKQIVIIVYILMILKKIHLYFMLLVLLKLFLLWVFLSLIMLCMFYFKILLKCKTFLLVPSFCCSCCAFTNYH